MSAYPPIGDYGVIGDGRTAALISRDGSIDWLCLPRFDSSSVFGALLDAQRGGRFYIRPAGGYQVRRRYVGPTNVLETTFEAASGAVQLTDLMPVADEETKRRVLSPEHEVLRRIEGLSGEVEVEVRCDPRPRYGTYPAAFRSKGSLGFRMEYGSRALTVRSDLELETDGGALVGRGVVRAGERRWVSLAFATQEPSVLPPLGDLADERLQRTLRWWEGLARRCTYDGPYRDAVLRSALALKLMVYTPSGAVIAAPTTSLPETPGGARNWDYRYCWLRDASITTRALYELGYGEDAEAFLSWMLHATRLTWPELQVLYDVYGGTSVDEWVLEGFEGYRGARPVRIGNAAKDQLQLDVYGEVLEAACQYVRRGGRIDRQSERMLLGLGETVCRRWREPDQGIWEIRAEPRHHTVSKALCWIALDRLLDLERRGQIRAPREEFERERAAIREAIEAEGFNRDLGHYVNAFGGQDVDASLLLLGLHQYVDPRSERMRRTHRAVRERLGVNGLLYRYPPETDGLHGIEGAFGICSFWSVELRALEGDLEGAARDFEHLLSFASDLGLYAEEIDPPTGQAVGNFPQAFTHVGLINAALALLPDQPGGIACGVDRPTRSSEVQI